jgi:3-hydroxyisobutyrate dehydrogenase-like beta-hydroxyacid dehydrogenase
VLYAGDQALFDELRPLLETLGAAHWTGPEPGRAAAFDMALLDLFWTATGGFVHATALARAEGIAPEELLPHALGIQRILEPIFAELVERWTNDRHDDASSALTSIANSLSHIRSAAAERGLDTTALDGWVRVVDRAVADGHGADEVSRVIDYLRP